MFPQPKPDFYYDGFNKRLFAAVPSWAKRILEVGCAGVTSDTNSRCGTRAGTSPVWSRTPAPP